MGGLLNYIIRRILFMVPVLFGVTMLVYFVGNAAGNPINLIYLSLRHPSPVVLAALRVYYHLNDPVYLRYLYYVWDLMHFNLGISITSGRPVADELGPWVW
ncbi:MAG: ABC transporter permease, partial [Nitrososphaerota archaeon]|nr:ABC transporter permease [Nitrososphaerota archaeon]